MKSKRKIYANILCNAAGVPFKMIITDGNFTTEIPITNSKLKTAKRAARDIYGATEIFISLFQE